MEIDFEALEWRLNPGMRMTIYIVWKYFLYQKFIGKPTDEFSYLRLQEYYDKFKFKIIPRKLFTRGRPLHWHTIERAIRALRSDFKPPFFISLGNGFFKPTDLFWEYIRYRKNKYGTFWPELRREVVR